VRLAREAAEHQTIAAQRLPYSERALRSPITPTAERITVNKISNDPNSIPNQRRLRLVKPSRRGPRADRDTALGLLRACLATEMRCVAEIVRHARSAPEASRKLLEDVLAIEEEHAAGLMGVLRMHDVAV
jgi:hypothetical protein